MISGGEVGGGAGSRPRPKFALFGSKESASAGPSRFHGCHTARHNSKENNRAAKRLLYDKRFSQQHPGKHCGCGRLAS